MNISRKWLSEYVKIDCSTSELCEKLTMAGIEVEAVKEKGNIPSSIIAAKILSRSPHPDADRLSICQVWDGSQELQIVCGAPNCDAGKTVPLAPIGTDFGGGFVIKKAKLRGVESNGMLCSGRELGISEDHEGLLILDETVVPGTPVAQLFHSDTEIEIEVTPNRPDWLSHYGVARDVACLLDTPVHLPELKTPPGTRNGDLVTNEAPDLCLRYIGRIIRDVKVAESPAWLKRHLESVGLRPINNVVDITNFVLMELGQPLHAFDLAKLEGQRIVIRRADPGEKITLLSGEEIELASKHLVICDAVKPMALAGIMGGLNSGVTSDTTDVLLESAVFLKSNIRSSSRELGVSSDSSYRYERGVDIEMAEFAGRRAAELITELCGGKAEDAIEFRHTQWEAPRILCRFDKVRRLLALDSSNERIVEIFCKLQLGVEEITDSSCVAVIPSFRTDLTREADLCEEVARIEGLDKIPLLPVTGGADNSIAEDEYYPNQLLRDQLIGLGLAECTHYSMVSLRSALADGRFTESDLVKLSNPLSLDLAYMRPSIFSEMLGSVGRNINHRNLNLRLFELGRVFCSNRKLFPEERFAVGIALTGQRHSERFSGELKECYDFYDLKGLLESLFALRRIKKVEFEKASDSRFRPGMCVAIKLGGKLAGFAGEVASAYIGDFRTNHPVFYAEIEAQALWNNSNKVEHYRAISAFPATSRDVAFAAPEELTHATVLNFIAKAQIPDLESVRLFDIFQDDKLKAQKCKSMAYQLTFRHPDRTLTDAEVNRAFDALRHKLAEGLKVELR